MPADWPPAWGHSDRGATRFPPCGAKTATTAAPASAFKLIILVLIVLVRRTTSRCCGVLPPLPLLGHGSELLPAQRPHVLRVQCPQQLNCSALLSLAGLGYRGCPKVSLASPSLPVTTRSTPCRLTTRHRIRNRAGLPQACSLAQLRGEHRQLHGNRFRALSPRGFQGYQRPRPSPLGAKPRFRFSTGFPLGDLAC